MRADDIRCQSRLSNVCFPVTRKGLGRVTETVQCSEHVDRRDPFRPPLANPHIEREIDSARYSIVDSATTEKGRLDFVEQFAGLDSASK